MRFDIGLVNRRHGVVVLDDHVGLAKALFDHALLPDQADEDIARRIDLVQQTFVVRDIGMDQRRIGFHSRQGIDQHRQFFVLDFD